MLARVPSDHTFGVLVKPDEYGAGDLIHNRAAGRFLRGKDKERGVLAAIRQHLKKANYHNFHDLNAAFKFYDKVKFQFLETKQSLVFIVLLILFDTFTILIAVISIWFRILSYLLLNFLC